MMTPFEDFVYLINHVLLGEEPVSEENSFISLAACIDFCYYADNRGFYPAGGHLGGIYRLHTVVLLPHTAQGR